MKRVFTNGVFDMLHAGHLYLLEKARGYGDHLTVGINSDASVRRIKGTDRPVVPQSERSIMLRALHWVDEVVIFDEDTPEDLIARLRPDVLVKGGDYRGRKVVGAEHAKDLQIVPLIGGLSTTERLRQIRLREAAWPGPYPEGKSWVGIDLDGTLAYYEPGYSRRLKIGDPIPEVAALMMKLKKEGERVAIFTARVSDLNKAALHRQAIDDWMITHFGFTLPVTCRKDYGMTLLYDDRCIRVPTNTGRWEQPND